MKKTVVYTRNDNNDKKLKEKIIELFNLSVDEIIVIEDEGNANDLSRKGYQALLELISQREVDEIYITEMSQLTRNNKEVHRLVDLLFQNRVKLFGKNFDSNSQHFIFMLHALDWIKDNSDSLTADKASRNTQLILAKALNIKYSSIIRFGLNSEAGYYTVDTKHQKDFLVDLEKYENAIKLFIRNEVA